MLSPKTSVTRSPLRTRARYNDVMGKPSLYEYAYGITNGNIFQGEHGIQCIHIGPERGNAHGPNEHVKLGWLPPISERYARIAHQFLSGR